MNEYLLDAREELKRLEHIIYVSLKYTRTVDIIRNALHRMVSMYDLIVEAFLEKALENHLITSLPKSPALRATTVQELYHDDAELQHYLRFYTFLKTILKLPFDKREEFRRHVSMIVYLNRSTVEINIDNLINCEKFVHNFYNYVYSLFIGKKEDDE